MEQNASLSLLPPAGGTIMAMRGGAMMQGGNVPVGFDPSASVIPLTPHQVNIEGMKGGGDPSQLPTTIATLLSAYRKKFTEVYRKYYNISGGLTADTAPSAAIRTLNSIIQVLDQLSNNLPESDESRKKFSPSVNSANELLSKISVDNVINANGDDISEPMKQLRGLARELNTILSEEPSVKESSANAPSANAPSVKESSANAPSATTSSTATSSATKSEPKPVQPISFNFFDKEYFDFVNDQSNPVRKNMIQVFKDVYKLADSTNFDPIINDIFNAIPKMNITNQNLKDFLIALGLQMALDDKQIESLPTNPKDTKITITPKNNQTEVVLIVPPVKTQGAQGLYMAAAATALLHSQQGAIDGTGSAGGAIGSTEPKSKSVTFNVYDGKSFTFSESPQVKDYTDLLTLLKADKEDSTTQLNILTEIYNGCITDGAISKMKDCTVFAEHLNKLGEQYANQIVGKSVNRSRTIKDSSNSNKSSSVGVKEMLTDGSTRITYLFQEFGPIRSPTEKKQIKEGLMKTLSSVKKPKADSFFKSIITSPTFDSLDTITTRGIENGGNTCWCNSILQLLYSVPEVRYHVARYDCDDDDFSNHISESSIKEARPSGIVCALRYIFLELEKNSSTFDELKSNPSNEPVSAEPYVIYLMKSFTAYINSSKVKKERLYSQQDSSEFLRFIFDMFQKAGQQNIVKPFLFTINTTYPGSEAEKPEDQKREDTMWSLTMSEFVDDKATQQYTDTFDTTIEKRLKNGSNGTFQQHYDIEVPAVCKYVIWQTSLLQLPEDMLNLGEIPIEPTINGHPFRLFFVVQKTGERGGGHYLGDRLDLHSDKYIDYNDENVSVNNGPGTFQSASLLVYRRMDESVGEQEFEKNVHKLEAAMEAAPADESMSGGAAKKSSAAQLKEDYGVWMKDLLSGRATNEKNIKLLETTPSPDKKRDITRAETLANSGTTILINLRNLYWNNGKKYAAYDDAGANLSETDVDKNKKLATESLSYSMKQDEKKWPPMIGMALLGRLGQINRTILMERFKKGTFEIGSSYWPLTPEYNVAKMLTDDMKTAKEEYLKLLKGTIVPPLKKKEIGVTGEDGEQNIDPADKKKAIEKRKMFWIAVFVTSKLMKEFLETKLKGIKPIPMHNEMIRLKKIKDNVDTLHSTLKKYETPDAGAALGEILKIREGCSDAKKEMERIQKRINAMSANSPEEIENRAANQTLITEITAKLEESNTLVQTIMDNYNKSKIKSIPSISDTAEPIIEPVSTNMAAAAAVSSQIKKELPSVKDWTNEARYNNGEPNGKSKVENIELPESSSSSSISSEENRQRQLEINEQRQRKNKEGINGPNTELTSLPNSPLSSKSQLAANKKEAASLLASMRTLSDEIKQLKKDPKQNSDKIREKIFELTAIRSNVNDIQGINKSNSTNAAKILKEAMNATQAVDSTSSSSANVANVNRNENRQPVIAESNERQASADSSSKSNITPTKKADSILALMRITLDGIKQLKEEPTSNSAKIQEEIVKLTGMRSNVADIEGINVSKSVEAAEILKEAMNAKQATRGFLNELVASSPARSPALSNHKISEANTKRLELINRAINKTQAALPSTQSSPNISRMAKRISNERAKLEAERKEKEDSQKEHKTRRAAENAALAVAQATRTANKEAERQARNKRLEEYKLKRAAEKAAEAAKQPPVPEVRTMSPLELQKSEEAKALQQAANEKINVIDKKINELAEEYTELELELKNKMGKNHPMRESKTNTLYKTEKELIDNYLKQMYILKDAIKDTQDNKEVYGGLYGELEVILGKIQGILVKDKDFKKNNYKDTYLTELELYKEGEVLRKKARYDIGLEKSRPVGSSKELGKKLAREMASNLYKGGRRTLRAAKKKRTLRAANKKRTLRASKKLRRSTPSK